MDIFDAFFDIFRVQNALKKLVKALTILILINNIFFSLVLQKAVEVIKHNSNKGFKRF